MENIYGIIPKEPIDLEFQLPEDVEQELLLRDNDNLRLLLEELEELEKYK